MSKNQTVEQTTFEHIWNHRCTHFTVLLFSKIAITVFFYYWFCYCFSRFSWFLFFHLYCFLFIAKCWKICGELLFVVPHGAPWFSLTDFSDDANYLESNLFPLKRLLIAWRSGRLFLSMIWLLSFSKKCHRCDFLFIHQVHFLLMLYNKPCLWRYQWTLRDRILLNKTNTIIFDDTIPETKFVLICTRWCRLLIHSSKILENSCYIFSFFSDSCQSTTTMRPYLMIIKAIIMQMMLYDQNCLIINFGELFFAELYWL